MFLSKLVKLGFDDELSHAWANFLIDRNCQTSFALLWGVTAKEVQRVFLLKCSN